MSQEKTASWQQRARQVVVTLLFVLLCMAGAILSVIEIGRQTYRWQGFGVELRVLPSTEGQTRLAFTPLGEVHARTHRAPVKFVAALQEISVEKLKHFIASKPTQEKVAQDFRRAARGALTNFVERQLVVAALGAMLIPLLLRRRRLREYVVGGLAGAALVGVMLACAGSTFNGKAFANPTYTGTLKQAPFIVQFGKDAFVKIDTLSQKLVNVAGNLSVLYGRIAGLPDSPTLDDGPDTFRILHVSDLHNNVAAFDFLQEVAEQFKVDLIVDTGDLTDFGSPPETAMVQHIGKLPFPYVFVLGNHDSQTVAKALSAKPNVTLLDGAVVTVKGVTLLGLPNPAAARASAGDVDTTPQELQAGEEQLLHVVNGMKTPPDIIAIHDPKETFRLWGRVPLVLCGHYHRPYIEVMSGPGPPVPPPNIPFLDGTTDPNSPKAPYKTVLCNAGTTGASGMRYLDQREGVPFSCDVLTFRRPAARAASGGAIPETLARPKLIAIDSIVLEGTLGAYSISHYNFNDSPSPPDTTGAAMTPPNPPDARR
jgi:predicted phosphodiesterase